MCNINFNCKLLGNVTFLMKVIITCNYGHILPLNGLAPLYHHKNWDGYTGCYRS